MRALDSKNVGHKQCPGLVDSVQHLCDAGFALHWLRERSKAPLKEAWSKEPVYSAAELQRQYRPGFNVGVRLGEPSRVADQRLYVMDMDIRVPARVEEAKAALRAFLPEFDTLPFVISGSGGESRHFYFTSEGVFRSRKLAHSADKFTDAAGKSHWAWEIELFGTGKQVALPPSVHPDTGRTYAWGREIDFDLLDMGLGPSVAAERVASWSPDRNIGLNDAEDDEDDLSAELRKAPMDLSEAEIKRTLADLPLPAWCEDRDGWLNVGMALHHQFEGSEKGLALWNEFSKQSSKFSAKDQKRVWDSFRITSKSMRFATLMKAAAEARLKAELIGAMDSDDDLLGGDEDDDDLLGDIPSLPAPAAEKKVDVDWVSKLDRTDEGAIKPTLPNVQLILAHDERTRGIIGLNLFTMSVVLRRRPGLKVMRKPSAKGTVQLTGRVWDLQDDINGDLWSDPMDDAVRAMIETPTRQGGYGVKITDRDLRSAVNNVAQGQAFHPIRDYLNALAWDGVERVETIFIRYLGAGDNAYSRAVARLTLLGAVARVMKPGHKFDFATILEGLQGKRKSTFIEILARHWFAELPETFDDRNKMIEAMQGAWILEIPELSGFGRSDVRQIKAFISAKREKTRLAYMKRSTVYERQCILIGSTNDKQYLRDDTGGRRFWPIECSVDVIDTTGFAAEVDQVWAEARVLYDRMRARQPHGDLPLYLTDHLARDMAAELQEQRRIETPEDAMAGRIAAWLDEPTSYDGFDDGGTVEVLRQKTCLLEIWEECFKRDQASYSSVQAQQLGRAMKKVPGWSQKAHARFGKYGPQRIFTRSAA